MIKAYSLVAAIALSAILAGNANAVVYKTDNAKSKVEFSGTHAGNKFNGKFEKWTADINFDPANLAGSSIKASFETGSAKTGNQMYDGTLPQADWFDSKTHPKAEFVSSSIKANADGSYIATGTLTIRKISKPAEFKFTLSDVKSSPVTAKGHLTIDRLAYDIGKKSDSGAEWVSRNIEVNFTLTASQAK